GAPGAGLLDGPGGDRRGVRRHHALARERRSRAPDRRALPARCARRGARGGRDRQQDRRRRGRPGMSVLPAGLEGVIAAETVLSHVDGERGILLVRGHTLAELVERHGYEGAVAILWEGFAGDGLTRVSITAALGAARQRAFARHEAWLAA